MKWSFSLGKVSGIDIRIHLTFFLIVGLGALQWSGPHGSSGAAFGAVLMLLLFTCVVLHELGHSLVAQAFGIPVREIVLLPLGGVAILGRNPEKPIHELLIAAAGPAVNVAIAAVLLAGLGPSAVLASLDGRGTVAGSLPDPSLATLLVWLLEANVTLVLFNLIPAVPLDGGRILRAVVAMFTGHARATRIAATIGQVFAVGFGVLGAVAGNFILVLVAVFIFFGAGFEGLHAQAKSVLGTKLVGDAYNKHAITLAPSDRLSRVVDYILTSYQPDFAVVHGGRLSGVITRDDVLKALASDPEDGYVATTMKRDVVRVDASTALPEVQQIMGERATRIVAVYSGDTYLGLVSREDIAEALTVCTFVQRQRRMREATP
jgi:Zn-dependent protease